MKTFNKTLIAGALLASAGVAQAEVAANVGVASSYLWRGYDLSYGSAVVSGGLDYAEGPFYAGVWASSGDDSYGTEYDLYAGFAGEIEGFSYDIGYVTYNYSGCSVVTDVVPASFDPLTLTFTPEVVTVEDDVCDFEEAYLSVGFSDFSLTAYDGDGYVYYALGAGFGDFSFTYGMWTDGSEGSHLDATYSMGDFGLTLSKVIDEDTAYGSDELLVAVSYSLPLDM